MSSWIKRKLSQVTNSSNSTSNSSSSPSRSQNPNTIRYEVFKSHWSQVAEIICLKDVDSSYILTNETLLRQPKPVTQDDVDAIRNLLEQMVYLLAEEQSSGLQLGPILEYLISQGLMAKLYEWFERSGDFKIQIAINQIKVYEVLVSQGEHSLLHHKQLVSPMLQLLASCQMLNSVEVDTHVVLLLNLLCVWISRDPTLLDVFFGSSTSQGSTKFIIFSLLIECIHREGSIGQQARDALLLCVTLSSANERVANYIVSTDFCPVLATGLSALYSSLPRQIDIRAEEWHFLHKQDWSQVPALVNFMNSFEFCNSVIEAAPGIVGETLLNYIYNGFLVSVFGPALHKPSASEVIVTTAYLNLFLQSVTAPELLQCFLRFLLCHRHDNSLIINTLIQRIGSSSKLAAVSLSLFRTLLDLDCEDLMLHLVFRYLIPCQHILASQHRSISDVDMYCASGHRFINLTPKYYKAHTQLGENILSAVTEAKELSETPKSTDVASSSDTTDTKERSNSQGSAGSNKSNHSDPSSVIASPTTMAEFGPDHESQMSLHTSYMDYLESANSAITACREACRNWSEPYDGTSPPTDAVTEIKGLSPGMVSSSMHQTSISLLSINEDQGPRSSHAVSDPMPLRYDKLSGATDSPALHALNATYQALNATAQAFSKKSLPAFSSIEEIREEDAAKAAAQEGRVLTNGVQGNGVTEEKDVENTEKSDEQPVVSEEITLEEEDAGSSQKEPSEQEEAEISDPKLDDKIGNERPLSPLQQSSSVDEFFRRLMESVPKKARESIEGKVALSEEKDELQTIDRLDSAEEESEGFHEGAPSANSDEDAFSLRSIEEDPDDVGDDTTSINSSFYETDIEYAPAEYSTPSIAPPLKLHATPYTGPFLSTLFGKIDQMPGNSLYENLLLTGIISRLSCYPQPLLRSFLLNTHVVFHPAVRSLYQVLAGVRNRIDAYASTVEDFSELIFRAEKHLLTRCSESVENVDANLVKETPMPVPKVKTRNTVLGEVFMRRRRQKKPVHRISKLESLIERKTRTFSFEPLTGAEGQSRFYTSTNTSAQFNKQINETQTKNVVFACVILHEFLKELAAISQEHAVTSL